MISQTSSTSPVIAPGYILQRLYLRERLAAMKPGRFVEVGPGPGHITALLLANGWRGTAYDIEAQTIAKLRDRFSAEIAGGRFLAVYGDWLQAHEEGVDLFVSCMVIEHLDDDDARKFAQRAGSCLGAGGRMITIVPSSPGHWGIEDEIAGHYRRYTDDTARQLMASAGLRTIHVAGLTFPLSNMLLPLSNVLVKRSEEKKLSLSMMERTKLSGDRDVPMKTTFPAVLKVLLNEITMYPLHLMQKMFRRSPKALVLYVEAIPIDLASGQ